MPPTTDKTKKKRKSSEDLLTKDSEESQPPEKVQKTEFSYIEFKVLLKNPATIFTGNNIYILDIPLGYLSCAISEFLDTIFCFYYKSNNRSQ